MSTPEELRQRIEAKLAAAREKYRRQYEEQHEKTIAIQKRRQRFDQVSRHILRDLFFPRLQELASFFDNCDPLAEPGPSQQHLELHFRHTDRFPVTARLNLSLTHDGSIENLIASYDLEILPVFIQFERHQEIRMPIDAIDEARLAEWVEQRILDFIDTYLQVEQTDQYQSDGYIVDPVCGMRILKAFAPARLEYNGRTYYFCTEECRHAFESDPARYAIASRT